MCLVAGTESLNENSELSGAAGFRDDPSSEEEESPVSWLEVPFD